MFVKPNVDHLHMIKPSRVARERNTNVPEEDEGIGTADYTFRKNNNKNYYYS